MSSNPHRLNEQEQLSLRISVAFLTGRLQEANTVNWALGLKQDVAVKRQAILEMLGSIDVSQFDEPWRSAWRLIEESWQTLPTRQNFSDEYRIQKRLQNGERSGSVLNAIVDLVKPRAEVTPFSAFHLQFVKPRKLPRQVSDLFSARLASGELDDPFVLKIDLVEDVVFLASLANALDSVVVEGLDIGKRIGWDGKGSLWKLGQLKRVYYVPVQDIPSGEHEPDRYHHGIAPSVKLLALVVSRLFELNATIARQFVSRWKQRDSPIHKRLWAAFSRNRDGTGAAELGEWLNTLDNRCFWDIYNFPEVFEVRATRFMEFDAKTQKAILNRIVKGPPRKHWPKKVTKEAFAKARAYWVVRELRRLEIAGSQLPEWVQARFGTMIGNFPDLAEMSTVTLGFWGSPTASWVAPNPDNRFDLLTGTDRLSSLESALLSVRQNRDDDLAGGAADWIQLKGNANKLVGDFEVGSDAGAAYPSVWDRFGWAHMPDQSPQGMPADNANAGYVPRILTLLRILPDATIAKCIDGLSHWLSSWEKSIMRFQDAQIVWLKFWPIAVSGTNGMVSSAEPISLNTIAQSTDDREPQDLDTLNTPAGRLVGVFVSACFDIGEGSRPFQNSDFLRLMRDQVMQATGRSKLIAQHRMIENLSYFLAADPDWTRPNLLDALSSNDPEILALWRALARTTQFHDVLQQIGSQLLDRTIDSRLGRETRQSLVFSVVVECLHAFFAAREPAVPYERVQQMIRSIEDEPRAYGAGAIQRFMRDMSAQAPDRSAPRTVEEIFRMAAAPFLRQVWPKERSLTTPGVSRALADIPATARGAFSEAVDAIDRFLVPFDCWSLLDFGLHGETAGEANLSVIDDQAKAASLLHLLDRTVGTAENSTVPYDLADALEQISSVASSLTELGPYRRLATIARRA
jgi:hypothetical protein